MAVKEFNMRNIFKGVWTALFGKGGGIETMRETTSLEYYSEHWKFEGQGGSSQSGPNYMRGYVMGRITGTPPCVWH